MAATYTDNGTNTPNGSHLEFTYTFPVIVSTDVKVALNGVTQATTKYTVSTSPAKITFNNSSVDSTVQESTGAPKTGVTVRVYRETAVGKNTGDEDPKAVFAAGSSVRAADLNSNFEQVLFAAHEQQDKLILAENINTGAITSAKILDDTIVNADVNTSAAIAGTKVSPDFGSQAVVTTGTLAAGATTVTGNITVSGTVDGRDVATDGSKLDGIEAGATSNQTNAEIRAAVEAATDSNVFTDADHSKLNAIEASATADQTAAEIRTLVESASDSNVFTDADHSKLNAIEASATADQTASEIRSLVESASDSNVFTDADHSKLNAIEASADVTDATNVNAAGAVMNSDTTTASMQFVVDEDNFSSDSATKVPTQQSTKAYIAATSQPLDSDLTTLAGMQSGTASILASGTALTSTTAELNLLDGKSIVTSVSGSSTDVQLPTAKAVNDQIVALMQAAGGYYPIADEVSFPNANPDPNDDAGTIVSIADAGGVVVNGSGVSTTGRTLGGATVTINGIDSSLYNSTIAAGKGMLVQTTSTLNTYTYHRLVIDEAGVASAQTLVSDFNQRYRTGSSNPTSSLDDGDLFFNTSSDKMLVYNATSSAWEEVQSVGNYFINTISSYSGTGGNSASFNGSAYRFVLSNPGANAEQHIVSVNGVVQKPNSGTSQPGEGFAIDGSSIIFSAAPATGSDFFIITIGASVNIGTPSNNTVSTAIIQNLAVNTDKLGADAVTGAKIADDAVGAEHIEVLDAPLVFADNIQAQFGAGTDLKIWHDSSQSRIKDSGPGDLRIGSSTLQIENPSESEVMAKFIENGAVELYYDNSKKFETSSTGGILSGTLWTALDNTKIAFGTQDDLQIYHDSSNSYLANTTGNLIIKDTTGTIYLQSTRIDFESEDGEQIAHFISDGAVELYYDNSKVFETNSNGIRIFGTEGNAGQLQIYADEGDDNADKWIIEATTSGGLEIKNLAAGSWEKNIECNGNENVELYYDNSKKFETNSSGTKTTGSHIMTNGGTVTGGDLSFADNSKAKFGDGNDLQIYHTNGSESYIDNSTGHLYIQNGGSNDDSNVYIRARDGENSIVCLDDGAVELYYDNEKTFETTSDGAAVYNTDGYAKLLIQGNEGNGALLQLHADDGDDNADKVRLGVFPSNNFAIQNYIDGAWEDCIKCTSAKAVKLFYDNSEVFSTDSNGINVVSASGDAHIDLSTVGGNHWGFWNQDNNIRFMEDSDERMRLHSGGGLTLYSGADCTLTINADTNNSGENDNPLLLFLQDGAVNCLGIGVVGDAGEYFSNSSQNSPYIEALDGHGGLGLEFATGNYRRMRINNGGVIDGDFNDTSDGNLKENIVSIGDSINKVKSLRPVTFDWKDPTKEKNDTGFIAQEVKEIYPSLIHGEEHTTEEPWKNYSINTNGLVAHLTKALQEAITKIETLETKVAALEAK